jgi:circadian clock protein KaiB
MDRFVFLLYTAENTENSALALANLMSICKSSLGECYSIDVIDVVQNPQRALADGIRMTPTLVKLAPRPKQTIVGTLSQTERVMVALGIPHAA